MVYLIGMRNTLTCLVLVLFTSLCQAAGRDERAKAFEHGPIHYESVTVARFWGYARSSKRTSYSLSPVVEAGVMRWLDVTVEGQNKGRIQVLIDGSFKTDDQSLINFANVGTITPSIRTRLLRGESVQVESTAEVASSLVSLKVTMELVDSAASDGSMKVKSKAKSPDGQIQFTTETILAPDGLPWQSQTRGDVIRGMTTYHVQVKLERK